MANFALTANTMYNTTPMWRYTAGTGTNPYSNADSFSLFITPTYTWNLPKTVKIYKYQNYEFSYVVETGLDHVWSKPRTKLSVKPRKRIDIGTSNDNAELKARATFRDILSEKEYRRYITNGFVVVKGEFGFYYQIFHKRAGYVIKVYKNNKFAGTLCIQTDQKCPPTDHVMNLMMRIKFDEVSVWEGANRNGFTEISPLINNVRLVA